MTDGHCFISYSAADGLEFATRLVDELQGRHPFIKVWFDKREMDASIVDWDDQLANAIKACKCLVFVMTPDSIAKGSTCKEEWTWALKYKKPVICLLKDKKAEVPFRLFNRQYIDISTNFDLGIAQLRSAIKRLDEPEGILEELDRRLSQAKRDLQRTPHEEEKPRIQAEIEDLNKQIEAQQKFVDNPKAAQEQTQKNIEAGLERERQPEKPSSKSQSTKFINPPPGIAPTYFQDRTVETEQVFKFLQDDSQRMMTIVGRGGVGKTAMVCRLLKGLEGGELPDGLGNMKVEGIVYLSESGSHRVNFANLFYDLCKLLTADAANALDAVYKNPQASTASKMSALLDRFTTGKVVLLLDNVEPLISVETFDISDAELDECMRALLHGAHSALKVILTTRVAPRGLNLCEPGRQRVLTLDSGLEQKYAVEMLREMDVDGKLGLKSGTDGVLGRACERTLGFPRALEALFAILASDRYTTLDELLVMPTPVNVVEALVGEAFNRLDTNAQKVMQALAVYNRPVTPAAVDYLLAPHIPAIDSAPILQRLANMDFALKENGRFYLHPVDREFAFGLVTENSDSQPAQLLSTHLISNHLPFTQHDLTSRAADYFRQARKPRAEWKELNDLSANLSEFDLRCDANDYNTAATVLKDIDYDYLLLWGHAQLLINMHQKIKELINDKSLVMWNLNVLGLTYTRIGKVKEAINFYQQGLNMAQEDKDRRWESVFLGNIGSAHYSLSDIKKSISFFEQRLGITENFSDRRLQAFDLENLGSAYVALGEPQKAIKLHEQALSINYEFKNRRGEGNTLGNLGNAYYFLGEINKAIKCQEQALVIRREIHDRRGEGNALSNLGSSYAVLGNIQKSLSLCELSLEIAREIGDKRGEGMALNNLADKYAKMGKKIESLECYEKGLECAQETGNKYGESISENGIANFLIEEGKCQQSIQHSHKSNQLGVAMSNPKVCSKSFMSLAQVYLFQNDLVNACATIEAALQYDVPENNHNASALHGIIALRQGDEVAARGAFVRAIGQADEILSKTAEYYDALDAKGIALSGLVVSGKWEVDSEKQKALDEAVEVFRKARKIAPHAGVVKSVLRLFDELVKCDEEGILKDVRIAVEGKE
ncbi:MAG: tetratricopeptide repeat protein [Chloroflexi bacterium]|nr:tetratricopeptide repeat protein [Chloroflexota bacterium]